MLQDNLCMNCMKEIGDAAVCPHCGFAADSPQIAPYLPMKTMVGGRYVIGKMLSAGGDGATYIAWDAERKVPVSVREYLPDGHIARAEDGRRVLVQSGSELLYRDGLSDFLELLRK